MVGGRTLSDKMNWQDVVKTEKWPGSLDDMLEDLVEIHHKLDTAESQARIDYHAVDKVADAIEILRKEIREREV